MAKSAEVKLAIFGRAGVGKSGKVFVVVVVVCVCLCVSLLLSGGRAYLLFSYVALLDEASFSLTQIFILHNQVLCPLLLLYGKAALLIIHKAMDTSGVLIYQGRMSDFQRNKIG